MVYQKISWWPQGFGLFVSSASAKPFALHDKESLPDPPKIDPIVIKPKNKAEILRSFLQIGNKKITRAISVGFPEKVHYSLNLENGQIIQVWKGDFADVKLIVDGILKNKTELINK